MSVRTLRPQGVRALSVGLVLACALVSAQVRAEEPVTAPTEDGLFEQGKALMAQKDFAHACELFDRSFKLDPATGTLLALALCHERAGKLASAYREYGDVVVRAHAEAGEQREHAAQAKATALEPNLSRLTIQVPAKANVHVRLDNATLDAAQFGTALALDGGNHIVEASAEGKLPWRSEIILSDAGDAKTLAIPALQDLLVIGEVQIEESRAVPAKNPVEPAPKAAAARRSTKDDSAAVQEARSSGLSATRVTGIVLFGAGVVALGVGTGFMVHAIQKNNASKSGCDGDLCTARARQQRLDAVGAGNTATAAIAIGAGLALSGAITYLVGGTGGDNRSDRVSAALSIGPGGASAFMQGAF